MPLGIGGGISCRNNSSALIVDNIIMGNSCVNYGGGIQADNSSPTISGNTVVGNYATFFGGGIDFYADAHPIVENNFIAWNMSRNAGGIAFGYDSNPIITGNVITNNTADSTGGGIAIVVTSYPIIENNTVTGNTAGFWGGGISMAEDCYPTITNTIFWGNDAPIADEVLIGLVWDDSIPSTLTIDYSDVEGGLASVFVDSGCTVDWGDSMINADPMFVLPDRPECRLLWESPCIDIGHPDMLDPDGTRIDMGACFFDQNDYLTLYVTPDKFWTEPGGEFGVTYTVINRWESPESCRLLSQVLLPGGGLLDIMELDQYTVPDETTIQAHIVHDVPMATPTGMYEYISGIGPPLSSDYDGDSFKFLVID
jgi:parallel beta-helix repeat protein